MDYNIIDEVKAIAEQCTLTSPETKQINSDIKHLEEPLKAAYRESMKAGDFKRALHLYQAYVTMPHLSDISTLVGDAAEPKNKEAEYISHASAWIAEVLSLLSNLDLKGHITDKSRRKL